MVDVVLIQPLTTQDSAKGPTLGSMETLGLGYLAAALDQAGISCQIINAEAYDLTTHVTADLALKAYPSVVGISPAALNMRNTLEIAELIKNAKPSVSVVLGGHHATLCAHEILLNESVIDFILLGDAERPFVHLARALLDGSPIPSLPSLATRDKYRTSVPLEIRQEIDLDSLHWPARPWMKDGTHGTFARLVTSRGCPFTCSFCTTPSFYRIPRFRSISDVVSEINCLADYGVEHIWLNDDLFVANSSASHRRAREFAASLKHSPRRVSFRPMVRADSFARDPRLIDDLIDAGMSHVFIGVESGNEDDLHLYRKRVDVRQNIEAILELKKRDRLVFQMGFIMFNPWSSVETLRANVIFLEHVGEAYRAFPFFRSLSAFPGTSIARALSEENLLGNVSYKSELPYAYGFQEESIGSFATLQHNHYPSIASLDATLYARVANLRKDGYKADADDLAIRSTQIHVAFFTQMLNAVEKNNFDSLRYVDQFECYSDAYSRLVR